ncbi:MAG TPA: sugar ABC transporter permease [Clostridiales bacterium]|jgi:putative aldouronate transport system permease protein|nr:sugar ABC transporter permease [Clostridiales bacterium]
MKISANKKVSRINMRKQISNNWDLYAMLLLPTIYIIVFKYIPMYGLQIAFKDYNIFKGMFGSPWVGFKHFNQFFQSTEFERLVGNTLILSVYSIIVGPILPILLAIILNYLINNKLKKTLQMVTYAPYFISTVVMVSIINQFFAIDFGPVNVMLKMMGLEQIDFLSNANIFPHLYVWTGLWQYTGFNSIIYLASLTGVDTTLHEAAIVDGASKLKRMWHIDLPSIKPTIIILLIMSVGSIMSTGFEKIYLMQNNLNLRTSEVIDTYVYKIGLASPMANYSFPTAIGLFQSIIGLFLIIIVNKISQKVSDISLW